MNELDVRDFDVDLAHYILPRLKQLRNRIDHVPPHYINEGRTAEEAFPVWLKDIDEMIASWNIIANSYSSFDDREYIMPGLRKFAENILHLWE